MRVLALVASEVERDTVLEALASLGMGPARLARLVPYTGTRVNDCGAGTLVLVPVGSPDVAAAACAAGVGANRTAPDLVLGIDVPPVDVPGEGGQARLPVTGPAGQALDPALLELAAARLPAVGAAGRVDGPVATGAYAAAQAHQRRFLALVAPTDELGLLLPALLSGDLRP